MQNGEIPVNILMLKYKRGSEYSYLTNDEALELFQSAKLAEKLARQLEAGNAVRSYFATLANSVSTMLSARNVRASSKVKSIEGVNTRQ